MEHTSILIYSQVALLIMIGFLSFFMIKIINAFKFFLYKKKLSRINLEEYIVFALSKNGYPSVLQQKNDKNSLIYL